MKAAQPAQAESDVSLPHDAEARIFLSYSRADLVEVQRLKHLLESEGFSVWMDLTEIKNGDWRREIVEKGIDPCRVFLLALTQNSADSEEVGQEIKVAREAHKHFLPIYLECPEQVRLPGDVRYILSGLQYFRFGSEVERLPEGIRQALREFGVEPSHRKSGNTLAETTVLRRCERLSWLIDREAQTKAFKEACRGYAVSQDPTRKPLLFYLHGPDSTAMSEYRESLSRFCLPRILGNEESDFGFYEIVLEEMNLDENSQDEWLMQIAEHLPPHVKRSVEAIAGYLGRSAPCSVLSFYAGTNGKMRFKNWKRFLNEFAKFWDRFPVSGGSMLIVKLELEYTGANPRVERDLRYWLEVERLYQEKRRRGSLPELVRVLHYLDKVKSSEAKRWLHLPEVKELLQTIHLRPHQAEQQLEGIFASNGDPLGMRILAGLMEHALIDQFKKHHF